MGNKYWFLYLFIQFIYNNKIKVENSFMFINDIMKCKN